VVLATGIALQLARAAARAPERWARGLRTGAVGIALIAAALGAATRVWRAVAERRALAGLPAAGGSSPNILLIVLDTVRRANLGVYGYARATTPSIDRRAREGVVFDRAVATAPWTLPSHASLFTGRSAGSLGADWRTPLVTGPRTLAEALGAHGYVTGGFVANMLYATWESGLARGFVHYDDYPMTPSLVLLHSAIARTGIMAQITRDHSPRGIVRALRSFNLRPARFPLYVERPANSVTDAFLAWQPTVGSRPFFAFLNYMDAHEPYHAPEPWATRFRGSATQPIDRYDGAIAWLDHEVGRLLDSLQKRGVLDRTIVVVTSDHGQQFGEHHLTSHANSLYLPLLEVPLLVRYPQAAPAGARVAALVTLRDVAATLLDLSGVHDAAGLPGTSLARYWRGTAAPAPAMAMAELSKGINVDTTIPNSRGAMQSLLDEHLHYIHNGWGREELFAWRSDSLELTNLAGEPAMQSDLVRMRAAVVALRQPVLDGLAAVATRARR
jgi:arylsulfatase A-like enzyme